MRCIVCIPSKGRPANITKLVNPFMQRLGLDYRIFVEPQDAHKYQFDNVVVLDANNQGLGYATTYAKKYAEDHNYELYFRIDDDVRAIGEIEKDITSIINAFKIAKVGAVVFPYDFEWYAASKSLFTRKNKRVQTCYIIRTKLFRPNVSVSTFDDFYQYLLLRKDGYDTLFCSKHAICCDPVGVNPGGLQLFDRSVLAMREINIFKSIDSTIGVIHKPNKPWKFEPKLTDKKYKSTPL